MTAPLSLIEQIEALIASRDIGHRAEALWRVTDLFMSGAGQFSDDQISLFDDVMSRLAREIDTAARATFGRRLASIPQAPPKIIRTLALDDEVVVAQPILATSERVDDATLVEGARTKSQDHLLAISRRSALTEMVTDVLVERGNRQVAISAASNPGARFSKFGYSTLVRRSEIDGDLAACVWSRSEIPRQHLLKLFADASETVQSRLVAADRGRADLIRDMVNKASEQFQAEARDRTAEYAAAEVSVRSLHQAGELSETHLAAFASAGKFNETAIALSMMCDLPIGLIERAFVREQADQLLILTKAIGLSWESVREIMRLRPEALENSITELELTRERFAKLKRETALMAVKFHRLRERGRGC
jgi:uncharacterized protein (DUF2336 family)